LINDTSSAFDPTDRSVLVTGGAGFIGSHLVRRLVDAGARVRVLDLFTTGRRENLSDVLDRVELIEGDICDPQIAHQVVAGVEYVLHLAALVSVPESIERPERNFAVNLGGTHNLLLAARDASVRRVVFSSSCAVYGDHAPPHHEGLAPRALSPYAAAKLGGEQLCRAFTHSYGLPTVCLRYFNVFGPGQNPQGGYAAAIPQFITTLLAGRQPTIFGDGLQTRDFVHVENVVDANLRACGATAAVGEVFNVSSGQETSLRELLTILAGLAGSAAAPLFHAPRPGDIQRSYGDISRAAALLGYQTTISLTAGLRETFAWYRARTIAAK
jgi:nucleoside-diphosphate-sugar epimerase